MMVKAILIGTQQQLHNIGNRFLPGGIPVEITEAEAKKHSDVVSFLGDKIISKREEESKELESEKESKILYSAIELKKMKKAEQVDILNSFGLDIPRLEDDRIKAIMEAQK